MPRDEHDVPIDYTITPNGGRPTTADNMAALIAESAPHHATLGDTIECAHSRALHRLVTDLFINRAWWMDEEKATEYSVAAADRLIEGAPIDLDVVATMGGLASAMLQLLGGGHVDERFLNAYRDARKG